MLHYCVISYITDKVVSRGVSEQACANNLTPGHTFGVGITIEQAYEEARERSAKAKQWYAGHVKRNS